MASKATGKGSEAVIKHRACDECRSRKLACSKEPEGCSRCKKEGIQCHYSPQKPMGRPRKRRHVEGEPAQPSQHQNSAVDDGFDYQLNQFSFDGYDPTMQPDMTLDPSLSFLNHQTTTSDLEFLDLLPNNYSANIPGTHPEPQIYAPTDSYDASMSVPFNLSGVDLLGGINFDEPDPSQEAVSKDINDSLQQYVAERVAQGLELEPAESTPEDSSSGSERYHPVDSPGSAPSTKRPVPTVNCSCLSSLYLSLDSLSNLPPDVTSAMRVARNASKVAHDVINCPSCSMPLIDDPASPPPIQCFQNLMFLGALVPSACNAYATILEMIDREAALAKQQGRSFWFSFEEIGGLWGTLASTHKGCPTFQTYNNKEMTPYMWRITMRAVLRVDVYGLTDQQLGQPSADRYIQQGLSDVVQKLEERSKKRHEILDEMVASGKIPKCVPWGVIYSDKPIPPEQRNCTKILETARNALENLVIA